jgi:hypothetical protein
VIRPDDAQAVPDRRRRAIEKALADLPGPLEQSEALLAAQERYLKVLRQLDQLLHLECPLEAASRAWDRARPR